MKKNYLFIFMWFILQYMNDKNTYILCVYIQNTALIRVIFSYCSKKLQKVCKGVSFLKNLPIKKSKVKKKVYNYTFSNNCLL